MLVVSILVVSYVGSIDLFHTMLVILLGIPINFFINMLIHLVAAITTIYVF